MTDKRFYRSLSFINRYSALLAIRRNWLSLLVTIFLSGCVISLPAFFYLFTYQFSKLIGPPKEQQQFTVFIQPLASEQKIDEIKQKISIMTNVGHVQFIDQQQALEEMKKLSGVSISIDILGVNPLYDTMILTPSKKLDDRELAKLKQLLTNLDSVEDVKVDEEWAVVMSQMISKTTLFLQIFGGVSTLIIGAMLFYFSILKSLGNQREIKISFLLGAYQWQPYQIYTALGLFGGFFSGVFSVIIISIAHGVYSSLWESWGLHELLGETIILPWPILVFMIAGGAFMGVLSSIIATYKANRMIHRETL